MEEYSRKISIFAKRQAMELRGMLAMMTQTISFLGNSSKTAIDQLQSIEKHIEKASDIDNIRDLKVRLSECLNVVRNESVRLRGESASKIAVLQRSLEETAPLVSEFSVETTVDPATGLQARSAAERSIAALIAGGEESILALFRLDRLGSINARYGRAVGNAALLLLEQHLGQQLPAGSVLFRWSGPVFVAALRGLSTISVVERRMKQIAAAKLERSFETQGRSVLLPITCSFKLHRISPQDSAEDFFQKLNRFAEGCIL